MNMSITEVNYSYTEVLALLSSLSETDIARIIQGFRLLGCESRTGMTVQDLLSEISCKVLSMDRAWPRGVSAVAYFVETGRSVISNEAKKYDREAITDPLILDRDESLEYDSPHLTRVDSTSPERHLLATQKQNILDSWVIKLKDIFSDDKDAICFITQKLAEAKKLSILRFCDLSEQSYRNVVKRVKDRIRKTFPAGFPWWEISE